MRDCTIQVGKAFKSDRFFLVFSYEMSHGLLLLRSRRTTAAPTRLDVLFQDVRAIELRMWFEGVEIEEVDAAYLQSAPARPDVLIEAGNKVYAVTGKDWRGYIVGGVMSVCEDDGDAMGPSALIG